MEGSKFCIITDHYSLKWLDNLKNPQGRLGRWALKMQQYDFEIILRKGKEHILPDALSRSVPVIDNVKVCMEATSITDKWYLNMVKRVK